MKITVWGARGSLPSPSPVTNKYGGNTSCVQIEDKDTFIILDAGSGIRRMNAIIRPDIKRIHILLTHLHIDHIMGLGFFAPLYNPNVKVTIWGPTSANYSLESRLTRYLSPPLFPICLQNLPCQLDFKEINHSTFAIDGITIKSSFVCHPGPTLGYRLENANGVLTYIPDHEPCLGSAGFPNEPDWTSGYELAQNADLLFHDGQYTKEEYDIRIGWGHSTMSDTIKFAKLAKVKHLLFFHFDPSHTDDYLEKRFKEATSNTNILFKIGIAAEGDIYHL